MGSRPNTLFILRFNVIVLHYHAYYYVHMYLCTIKLFEDYVPLNFLRNRRLIAWEDPVLNPWTEKQMAHLVEKKEAISLHE